MGYLNVKSDYTYIRGKSPMGIGPASQDFSPMIGSHPAEAIYNSIVEPKKWSGQARPTSPKPDPLAEQFRNPQPARRAMLHQAEPDLKRKLTAHGITERQASLQRLESRQRR